MRTRIVCSAILLCIVLSSSYGQEIWVSSPSKGDTLFIGDTIQIVFDADSAYRAIASSTVIKVSLNAGVDWAKVCPVEDPSYCPVAIWKPYWGNVRWIVPDSLHIVDQVVPSVSDNVIFRVYDYGNSELEGFSNGSCMIARRNGVTGVKNRYTMRSITSSRSSEEGCGAGAVVAIFVPLLWRFPRRRRSGKKL